MNRETHEIITKLEETMRSVGVLDFSGEMQLLEWAKSTSRDGPKVKFMLQDDDSVEPFEIATIRKGKTAGQLYHVFAIRIDEPAIKQSTGVVCRQSVDQDKEPNRLAQAMHKDGYFRNPKLWIALEEADIYTCDQHKLFIESQPCCGIKFAQHIECQGDVVWHHVKTAANSGVGIKPLDWFTVPLCNAHHMTWAHGSHKGSATHEDRHDVLLPFSVSLSADQAKEMFKKTLGIASLSEVTLDLLNAFEEEVFGEVTNHYRQGY
jgi:hypothetical protein